MIADTLAQHRRELDATLAALVAVRDHAEREHDLLGGIVEELTELRRRIERVEELVAAADAPVELDAGRHSRNVVVEQCSATSPTYGVRCARRRGHPGYHESADRVSWPAGRREREGVRS